MVFLRCSFIESWLSRLQTLALSFTTKKKYLIHQLRKELEKLYVDQWENERQNIIRKQQKSKLELYSNIKSSYRRETYIDYVRDIQTRKYITQIRLSAHKFPIKQGCYKNIPREQRICNLCCNNLVGHEFHYLFVCNEFSLRQRRQTFINDILKVNTHFIKFDKNLFDHILSLNDCSIFDLTVLFIKDIMENYISAISKFQNQYVYYNKVLELYCFFSFLLGLH